MDLGVTDMTNMGAAMAPAAFDTLQAVFRDTGTVPGDYDLILTGDLGDVGSRIVLELFAREGVTLENYTDCGLLLYDRKRQDMHAGGSRLRLLCGGAQRLSAAGDAPGPVAAGAVRPHRGAAEPHQFISRGESIPGICHAVVLGTGRRRMRDGVSQCLSLRRAAVRRGPDHSGSTAPSLTPARILTGYVVAGVLLQAVGVYQYIVDWGGAGATVPLTGFGYSLAKGVAKAVAEDGLLGVLTGGLTATSGGIAAAVVLSLLAALLVRAKEKR